MGSAALGLAGGAQAGLLALILAPLIQLILLSTRSAAVLEGRDPLRSSAIN